jgi:hypothetical protein
MYPFWNSNLKYGAKNNNEKKHLNNQKRIHFAGEPNFYGRYVAPL